MIYCPLCKKVMEHVITSPHPEEPWYEQSLFKCDPCKMEGFIETTFQLKCTCGAPNGFRHSKDCNANRLREVAP